MAAPNPLNTLHPSINCDRDPRIAAAPAPSITLLVEIGMLHTAIAAARDELDTLISALKCVAHPERDEPVPMAAALTNPVPEAVAGVRDARCNVEALAVRMSELRSRLALY